MLSCTFIDHYLLPSACISNLKVPSFQCCPVLVLSTFKDIALALARVSIFVVLVVVVKGPKDELACESVG